MGSLGEGRGAFLSPRRLECFREDANSDRPATPAFHPGLSSAPKSTTKKNGLFSLLFRAPNAVGQRRFAARESGVKGRGRSTTLKAKLKGEGMLLATFPKFTSGNSPRFCKRATRKFRRHCCSTGAIVTFFCTRNAIIK